MDSDLNNKVFPLPNGKRMRVEMFGVRILDKYGNTVLESSSKKESWFDRSLSRADRRLLSEMKIRR
jgi:hypothetical protein